MHWMRPVHWRCFRIRDMTTNFDRISIFCYASAYCNRGLYTSKKRRSMYDNLVLPPSALTQLWLWMAGFVLIVATNIYQSWSSRGAIGRGRFYGTLPQV